MTQLTGVPSTRPSLSLSDIFSSVAEVCGFMESGSFKVKKEQTCIGRTRYQVVVSSACIAQTVSVVAVTYPTMPRTE